MTDREPPRKRLRKRTCRSCGSLLTTDLCSCGQWNFAVSNLNDETILLSDVDSSEIKRHATGPWDKCFGGGIAVTSVTLIGGEPGAGKSTLSLQIADVLASAREVLYVAAEEDLASIKDRARRLCLPNTARIRMVPALGGCGDLGPILQNRKPAAIFLDSIPGLCGEDQDLAVETASRFKPYAVELRAPVLIVDHVNKRDELAGMMALQHAVDTTMAFFATDNGEERELYTLKNRYGPAHVSAILEMTEFGLKEKKR